MSPLAGLGLTLLTARCLVGYQPRVVSVQVHAASSGVTPTAKIMVLNAIEWGRSSPDAINPTGANASLTVQRQQIGPVTWPDGAQFRRQP